MPCFQAVDFLFYSFSLPPSVLSLFFFWGGGRGSILGLFSKVSETQCLKERFIFLELR